MTGWGLAHGKDLARISRELRHMDEREVLRRFRRELRATAAPMVPAVRASIAAIPVKGTGGSTGLRRRLQRAARLIVRTSGRSAMVRVLVDPKRMPDGQKALPQYMEGAGGHTRWRHPVFGRDPWVQQPSHAYFFPVVRRLGPASRVAASRAVRSVTKDIT